MIPSDSIVDNYGQEAAVITQRQYIRYGYIHQDTPVAALVEAYGDQEVIITTGSHKNGVVQPEFTVRAIFGTQTYTTENIDMEQCLQFALNMTELSPDALLEATLFGAEEATRKISTSRGKLERFMRGMQIVLEGDVANRVYGVEQLQHDGISDRVSEIIRNAGNKFELSRYAAGTRDASATFLYENAERFMKWMVTSYVLRHTVRELRPVYVLSVIQDAIVDLVVDQFRRIVPGWDIILIPVDAAGGNVRDKHIIELPGYYPMPGTLVVAALL